VTSTEAETTAALEELVENGRVASLAGALVAAQRRMPAVGKDSENPHFHSRFVSLDSLIAATRPVLNEHGLAITQFPVTVDGLPVLRTTLLHAASGESLSGDTPLYLSRNDMQGYGAAVTYARRYAWAAVLGIASEEDTDGNAPQQQSAAAAEKPKAAPAAAAKGKASQKQVGLLAIKVKELDEASSPIPSDYPGAESWIEVLRARLRAEYGVESRTELTVKQASELIDWLEAQAIPF
jgi:ERF superfamily